MTKMLIRARDFFVIEFRGSLVIIAGLVFCCLTPAQAQNHRIVGYYYGKASRAGYQFSKTPVEMLTDLIYSQAKPTANGECQLPHPDVDLPNLTELKSLRLRNPRLSILLSVGGWSGSMYFSDIAASSSSRRQFSASCVALIKKYGFDGLDIDWEYPVTGGKPTDHKRKSDKHNFVLLLKEMRTDLDAFSPEHHLLLTIASTCYRYHLRDLAAREMSSTLDWFNVMCYDFNDMEPGVTSHGSPLFASGNTEAGKYANCDAAVRWYLDQDVPSEKVVLGVPFYGQIWNGVADANGGLYEPYSDRPGDGTLSFREIEQSYLPTYSRHWDEQAKVPWLYRNETRIMISYEDAESLSAKARYAIEKNLGGIMFWDISQDDDRSTLLRSIYQQLGR